MRIYLVGLPHAGKTAVGKKLAEQLNYEFIDMNVEIEKEALMFIDEIYEIYGQKTITNTEKTLLEKFLQKDNFVLATNAHIISDRSIKKLLDGHVIFIDVDEESIVKRMMDEEMSYLLSDISLADYYQKSFLKYRNFADEIVNNNQEIEKTVKDLIMMISKLENK